MKKPIPKRYTLIIYIAITILVGILAYLALVLVAQYRYIAREQAAHGKRMQISNFRKHRALAVGDISLIESWMTFDYIATAFRIPTSFLKTELNITDPRFPRITLHKYAKTYGMNESEFTTSVIAAAGKYFVSVATSTQK